MLQSDNTLFMVYDKDDKRYLHTIYQLSLSWDAHEDEAMKFPTIEIARAVKEYIEWLHNIGTLTILQRVTTMQEVE